MSLFENSPKCLFYKYMHEGLCLQCYLSRSVNYKFYKQLILYVNIKRISAHRLNVETGQFYNVERQYIFCG